MEKTDKVIFLVTVTAYEALGEPAVKWIAGQSDHGMGIKDST